MDRHNIPPEVRRLPLPATATAPLRRVEHQPQRVLDGAHLVDAAMTAPARASARSHAGAALSPARKAATTPGTHGGIGAAVAASGSNRPQTPAISRFFGITIAVFSTITTIRISTHATRKGRRRSASTILR
jgi:hypothetical protein